MLTFSLSILLCLQNASALPISLNVGTGEVLVNKCENNYY